MKEVKGTPVFRNPNKPTEERVNDLLKRLTLTQKISQMFVLRHKFDTVVSKKDLRETYFLMLTTVHQPCYFEHYCREYRLCAGRGCS